MEGHTLSAEKIAEQFDAIDGIETAYTNPNKPKVFVKVMDEAAVGSYFGTLRRLGLEHSGCTRNGLAKTVMDSWVHATE